ncbi:SRR1-like protein [Plasmodium ovale]|uniref:SRR1-like protein n=2 Tax=Plasmodium ovale TaxID=36330 RepID=A0A1A8VLP6_PLAOA|nr:SRR1-like protein [Plasmodium ovale curtisi]SBS93370.1 SRR1-like protein [Plasmodium ovale curtisi]SCN43095.1 SRR1-like protein [Plasmodium ovale]
MDEWIHIQRKQKFSKKKYRYKDEREEKLLLSGEDKKDVCRDKDKESVNENKTMHYEDKNAKHIHNEVKKVTSYLEKSLFFENFKEKFNQISQKNGNIAGAICLGLGSLADMNLNNKRSCMYQLSFILLVRKTYNIPQMYVYDPKITKIDAIVYALLDVTVLDAPDQASKGQKEREEVEAGVRENVVEDVGDTIGRNVGVGGTPLGSGGQKMLLFMPHCDVSLYGQVLCDLFTREQLRYTNAHFSFNLENTIFLGNSFDYYRDHMYLYKPLGLPSCAIRMLQKNEQSLNVKWKDAHLNRLKRNFKPAHFIFYLSNFLEEIKFPICSEQKQAFNDLSIIIFRKISNKVTFWSNVCEFLLDQKKE